jgi:hypothetical protein
MGWQTFRITDHIEAYKVSHELMDGLFAALVAHGQQKDAAIFSSFNLDDGSTDYYFTPRAIEIAGHFARAHNAQPCEAPPLIDGMSLLAGDQRARDLLVQK